MTLPLPDPLVDQREWGEERTGVQRNFEALAQRLDYMTAMFAPELLVTALPTTGTAGQIIYYDTGTDGVVWAFRYDAASASAYKWQFIGGAPLVNVVSTGGTDETTTSTSYTNLTTAGPTVTVPLAGDYDSHFDIEAFRNDGGAGTDAYVAFQHGSTNNAADAERISNGSGQLVPGSAQRRWTGMAASDVIQAKYRVSSSTGRFRGQRTMSVTPVRVG